MHSEPIAPIIVEIVTELARMLRLEIDEITMDRYVKALSILSVEELRYAANKSLTEWSDLYHLPLPKHFLEWAGMMPRKKPAQKALSEQANPDHSEWAMKGISFMQREDKTPAQKLDFFREMEKMFPGKGWAMEGHHLEKHYRKSGLI
jgi:hypothetical protein